MSIPIILICLVATLLIAKYVVSLTGQRKKVVALAPTVVVPQRRNPPQQQFVPQGLNPPHTSTPNNNVAYGQANGPISSSPITPASPSPNIGDQSGQTLPPEPTPQPPVQMEGHVHIGDAHLSFENDGHGHEQCIGRVLIVNDGPYAVTDFRLGLSVLGSEYALVPFEGSISFPTPILYRRIEAGGSLDVPVTTGGVYTSFFVSGPKGVTLEASLDGPPGVVTDRKDLL